MVFMISSCGENAEETAVPTNDVEIDINILSDKLADGIKYDDNIGKVESFVIDMLYDCSSLSVASAGYGSSGGTSEAIAIFECETEEDADKVILKLELYKESMADDFVRYTPGEVEKLENAVIQKVGKYAVFCVSPDFEKAKEIINNYISELQK